MQYRLGRGINEKVKIIVIEHDLKGLNLKKKL
jgi:hypothetical protein